MEGRYKEPLSEVSQWRRNSLHFGREMTEEAQGAPSVERGRRGRPGSGSSRVNGSGTWGCSGAIPSGGRSLGTAGSPGKREGTRDPSLLTCQMMVREGRQTKGTYTRLKEARNIFSKYWSNQVFTVLIFKC